MKIWSEPPPGRGDGDGGSIDRAERERHDRERQAALREAGIDLDPGPPAERGAGADRAVGPDEAHRHPPGAPADHPHPHRHGGHDEHPAIGIVGAGAVGTALGVALTRAGWPIAAVASRDATRRERFQRLTGTRRAFAHPAALLDEVELIVLAVPDDVIASLAGEMRLYSGQALVHTSGLLGAEVLAPAMAAGTQAGSFHPLVAFADLERAVEALAGSTIAIEGDDELAGLLARMAEAIGAVPVRLPPGTKPAYHAAAVLSAGGLVALLDAVAELGRVIGLDEAGSLTIFGRLSLQTLDNARDLGIEAALTGPMTRGDAGTVAAHLAALDAHAPAAAALYRVLAEREIAIAERRGAVGSDGAALLRATLAKGP
jgi:predicted short-subunit dehydrogenase-like oxidoreductase (DUF2520 family)